SRYLNDERFTELNLYLADYYKKNNKYKACLTVLLDYIQQKKAAPRIFKICGDLYLDIKDYYNASSYYQSVLAKLQSGHMKMKILNNTAYARYHQQDYEKALHLIKRACQMQSKNPALYYNKALILKHTGQYRQYTTALDDALKYIKYNYNDKLKSQILLEYGLKTLQQGNISTARKYLKKAVRSDPDNTVAEYQLNQLN
ncbi:MAG TPA: tetratricopeptide repeat protein, partial [Spirochaetota bacterium]|nr:tetratricopeptide repeat protein [Spirochaetota bacterium]